MHDHRSHDDRVWSLLLAMSTERQQKMVQDPQIQAVKEILKMHLRFLTNANDVFYTQFRISENRFNEIIIKLAITSYNRNQINTPELKKFLDVYTDNNWQKLTDYYGQLENQFLLRIPQRNALFNIINIIYNDNYDLFKGFIENKYNYEFDPRSTITDIKKIIQVSVLKKDENFGLSKYLLENLDIFK